MPADRLQNEISFTFKDKNKFTKTYLSAEFIYVMKQTRIPGDNGGKQDYKDAPDAYSLFNTDAGTTIVINKIPIALSIGVRNVFNTVYRDYLNSLRYFIDETGRNIQVRIKIPFKHLH